MDNDQVALHYVNLMISEAQRAEEPFSLHNRSITSVPCYYNLFIYLGFYIALSTVQVISRWVAGRAEETSTYSWSRFCTVNCRPAASN